MNILKKLLIIALIAIVAFVYIFVFTALFRASKGLFWILIIFTILMALIFQGKEV